MVEFRRIYVATRVGPDIFSIRKSAYWNRMAIETRKWFWPTSGAQNHRSHAWFPRTFNALFSFSQEKKNAHDQGFTRMGCTLCRVLFILVSGPCSNGISSGYECRQIRYSKARRSCQSLKKRNVEDLNMAIEMILSGITNLLIKLVAAFVWIGANSLGDIANKPTKANLFLLFCIHVTIGVLLGYASTAAFDNAIIKHDLVDLINLVATPAFVGALFIAIRRLAYKKHQRETEKFTFILIYTNLFFFIFARMVFI